MRYTFIGKDLTITDAMKEKVIKKIGKLEKLIPENAEVFVTISVVKLSHTVEVTIPLQRRILRAEITTQDTYSAIDEVVDILEKQMVKYKERLKHKSKKDTKFKEELNFMSFDIDYGDEVDSVKIAKIKRFALKPMDAEEAVMEMELLNHNFYVFRNGDTDDTNVIYRRKNGSYGLIEPEY